MHRRGDCPIPTLSATGRSSSILTQARQRRIRRAVRDEIAQAEQRGWIGDTASLRSGKRYFIEDAHAKTTPFRACGNYLRKLGRRDGDLSIRRYFYIGRRHGVHVYEPYNIHRDVQETQLHQRLIWQEDQPDFVALRSSYRYAIED